MTPERWQQIRDLLERAMELAPGERPAFLDRSCAGDASLRQEVETLLASSDDVRSSFMQSQPPRAALSTGTRVGEYEIKSLLGSGGMGEVYRAHDSRLGRDVAIKVLPPSFSADSNRLRRFEQEARAAAALNHPNILAVFQLGTHAGSPYLVTELLEGEPLRELLRRGRLAVRRVIDYGVQIARGLSAAHEKGIVHRDLKPENLFVTKDGRVKILDFGLARLTQSLPSSEQSALTAGGTEPGMVMGTVGYMSPEQVRAQPADHRTDIFSFGTILFEMLTGTRAFQKPTSPETMSSILNDDPPSISQIGQNVPPALQRVVSRCLEKSPEQRFQSASDLAFALDALSETTSVSTAGIPRATSSKISTVWLVAAAFVFVVAGAAALLLLSQPKPPKLGHVKQLTHDGWPKGDNSPVLLTDGARLYFTETVSGNDVITQVSVAGGETTPVHTTLPWLGLYDISSDGSQLLINSGDSDLDNPLWLLPLPSGSPRRLGDISASWAAWSPDGRNIAYIKSASEVHIADANGVSDHRILSKEGLFSAVGFVELIWSPDGKRIRFRVFNPQTSRSAFWDMNADGSNVRLVLPEDWNSGASKNIGRWTADRNYFIFQVWDHVEAELWAQRDCEHSWLWCRPVVFRLTNGPLRYLFPMPSKDGSELFAGGGSRRAELVRYDSRAAQFAPFLGGPSVFAANFSPDGQWVTWISYPDLTLWCAKADGSDARQLTYRPVEVDQPRWSHDSKRIAFVALDPGKLWRIYTIAKEGGSLEPMATEQRAEFNPTWGPNDSSITFGRGEEQGIAIETRDLKTGSVTEIPDSQGLWFPERSPDGKFLVAQSRDNHRLLIFDFARSKWSEIPGKNWNLGNSYFSHDGKYVYFENEAGSTIYRFSIADGKLQQMASLKQLRRPWVNGGSWFGLAPDDSILAMRDLGTHEIYAFDLEK